MAVTLDHATRSERGLARHNNQDGLYAGRRLLAVADGMGGHVGGAVAAQVTIGALAGADAVPQLGGEARVLAAAVQSANSALAGRVAAQPELAGMGTTVTAILFGDNGFALAHIGDSRAYLLRADRLVRLTHDETFVQALVDAGQITSEQAAHHPQRSVILRALTGDPVQPVLATCTVQDGDRLLLCSDGLSAVVSDEVIARVLAERTPAQAVDELMTLAYAGGGPDNVSIIVTDVAADRR
jgi:protein phosphatase